MSYQRHPCDDVERALVSLRDALCQWERSTGRKNVFILREEGFCARVMDGCPVPEGVSDAMLLQYIP